MTSPFSVPQHLDKTVSGGCDLDTTSAGWLHIYMVAEQKIAELEAVKKVAREHLEVALGASETGFIDGQPAVRWSVVQTRRLDQKKVREDYPDIYAACTASSTSRRFSPVRPHD